MYHVKTFKKEDSLLAIACARHYLKEERNKKTTTTTTTIVQCAKQTLWTDGHKTQDWQTNRARTPNTMQLL